MTLVASSYGDFLSILFLSLIDRFNSSEGLLIVVLL